VLCHITKMPLLSYIIVIQIIDVEKHFSVFMSCRRFLIFNVFKILCIRNRKIRTLIEIGELRKCFFFQVVYVYYVDKNSTQPDYYWLRNTEPRSNVLQMTVCESHILAFYVKISRSCSVNDCKDYKNVPTACCAWNSFWKSIPKYIK